MNLREIEREAMHLTEDERAELAQNLLLSLDAPTDDDIAGDWLMEASRRACELDEERVQPIPAEDVRRKAMSLLR
ncbi:MAG: addiction module protein [Thiocapsa sp.]|uniref:addiction module protein n=1 Tax=Thiocapsa sp. TaxID=2024551 RepID=UPI001BD15A6A|nr:addiction module protein [Thiocapsa sp.]QVL50028.1 MAG: addiction module protein [Thiocapsa sp.]